MEINPCEQLPLGRMRRTLDAIWILEFWIACVGFIRSWIILYVLYIGVRGARPLLILPESPAHGACQPMTMVLALSMWMNFETGRRESRQI
jgi:hypothetical protein